MGVRTHLRVVHRHSRQSRAPTAERPHVQRPLQKPACTDPRLSRRQANRVTAPCLSDAALEAARAADMVLIPCRPSAADLTAIGASVELARTAAVPTHAILNAAPVRNPLTEQACEAIARYGINTVPVVIHQRIDHVHAYTAGLAATELAPRSKAARELDALFAWITQGALL